MIKHCISGWTVRDGSPSGMIVRDMLEKGYSCTEIAKATGYNVLSVMKFKEKMNDKNTK